MDTPEISIPFSRIERHPRISLAIICGNEEKLICRMLDSFKDAFDEICAVRAIGNLPADETINRLKDWAINNGKDYKIGEFLNTGAGKDRPHVDDFAAARNQAFDLATSPWIFWADVDDLLSDGGAGYIRECTRQGQKSCYGFYYFVSDARMPARERLIKKGTWRWEKAVHECMAPVGHNESIQLVPDGPRWIHAADVENRPITSHDRNTWLLSNKVPAAMTWFAHYYLSIEAYNSGKKDKAAEHAQIALADKTIPQPYKYELFLNFAKMAERPEEQRGWAMRAFDIDPMRREALAWLACWGLNYGVPAQALAFARCMNSLPMQPMERRPMNQEDFVYTWLGLQIINRAIRAFGQSETALKYETEQFTQAKGKITLVHATRGRIDQAEQARAAWFFRAKNPKAIEHIFIVDSDDTEVIEEFKRQGFRFIAVDSGGGSVAAWNAGAAQAAGDVVIQMSDDFMPPVNWDEAVLARMGDTKKPAVLAVSDGLRSDNLLCIAIATKARIAQQEGKTLFWPEYKSVFSDNEFSVRAYADGVVIEARDLVFQHQHPLARGITDFAQMDKTYQESNSRERYNEGQEVFTRRNQAYLDKAKA